MEWHCNLITLSRLHLNAITLKILKIFHMNFGGNVYSNHGIPQIDLQSRHNFKILGVFEETDKLNLKFI
jgi:hypothetical protein